MPRTGFEPDCKTASSPHKRSFGVILASIPATSASYTSNFEGGFCSSQSMPAIADISTVTTPTPSRTTGIEWRPAQPSSPSVGLPHLPALTQRAWTPVTSISPCRTCMIPCRGGIHLGKQHCRLSFACRTSDGAEEMCTRGGVMLQSRGWRFRIFLDNKHALSG